MTTVRDTIVLDFRQLEDAAKRSEVVASQIQRIRTTAAEQGAGARVRRSLGPGRGIPSNGATRFAREAGLETAKSAVSAETILSQSAGQLGSRGVTTALGASLGGPAGAVAGLAVAVAIELATGEGPAARRVEQWIERVIEQVVPQRIRDALEREQRIKEVQAEAKAAAARARGNPARVSDDPRIRDEASRALDTAHRRRVTAEAEGAGAGGGTPGGL